MGNLLFIVMHACALLFGFVFLVITIPTHLIYLAIRARKQPADPGQPTPETHVKCPDCAELIRREARICKHCGCKLIPQ